MNILVIGSGGREHALVRALKLSNKVSQIFCAPGNAGLADSATLLKINPSDHQALIQICKNENIGLALIGPEEPLVAGLSDALRAEGVSVFGPSKQSAQLEGSKLFAKQFMQAAGVPTAPAVSVQTVRETLDAADDFTAPYVLKADGLAAGKGVFICRDRDELKTAAENIFEKRTLGEAGSTALLEQNLQGYELSVLVLTNGEDFEVLPLAQDHKRLLNDNKGPNTGGMGTVAPLHIDETLRKKINEHVIAPSIHELKKRNYLYRGVLFIGLMIVNNEPYVLEYNVRFGDPETQVILPLIDGDLAHIFSELAEGRLRPLKYHLGHAFCIVNAAAGYPDTPVKGTLITLPEASTNPHTQNASQTSESYILHAGTQVNAQRQLVSSGGRVLNVVAVAANREEARAAAYRLNELIQMDGRQYRTDLGLNTNR